MRLLVAIVHGVLLVSAGCASSKWAMDDPDYRAKYDRPYGEAEKVPRMAKQIVDARHVVDKPGGYFGIAAQGDPFALGAELGMFHYPRAWLERRIALAGLVGAGKINAFGGFSAGLRVQPPTRVAPFVGAGLFGGISALKVDATRDGVDNDGDGWADEWSETKHDFLGAVYPEIGVHLWSTSRVRLTASASYFVTTEGREGDFWFVGTSLSLLSGG